MQSHTPVTPESTAVIQTLLQPPETKEDKPAIDLVTRKQVIEAIINSHRARIQPAGLTSAHDNEMQVDEYLDHLVTMADPEIVTVLHMTMIMDAWFVKHSQDVLDKQTYCTLMMASLLMALKFQEWPLDNEKNAKELAIMEVSFAKVAGSTLANLKEREDAVFKDVGSDIRYSGEAYRATQARLLPGHDEIFGEKVEYKHENCMDETPRLAHLSPENFKRIRTELIKNITQGFDKVIKTGITRKIEPDKLGKFPYDRRVDALSIAEYLDRLVEYLNPEIPTLVYMAVYMGIYFEKTKDTFNELNCYSLVLTSLMASLQICEDKRRVRRKDEKFLKDVTGFTRNEIKNNMDALFAIIPLNCLLDKSLYETFHSRFLPGYTLDLMVIPAAPSLAVPPEPSLQVPPGPAAAFHP